MIPRPVHLLRTVRVLLIKIDRFHHAQDPAVVASGYNDVVDTGNCSENEKQKRGYKDSNLEMTESE